MGCHSSSELKFVLNFANISTLALLELLYLKKILVVGVNDLLLINTKRCAFLQISQYHNLRSDVSMMACITAGSWIESPCGPCRHASTAP